MQPEGPFSFTLYGASAAGRGFARCLGARRGRAVPRAEGGTERALYLKDAGFAARLIEGLPDGCAIVLTGDAHAVGAAALRLAEAGGELAAAGVPEPPVLAAGQPADVAFAGLAGMLGEAIRYHVAGALAGEAIEPVHQMRVAVRRLRSAIGLFRRVADGPALQEIARELKDLMRLLAPARDWDVFLAGTGAVMADEFADDASVGTMLEAAAQAREAAYAALAAYLRGAAFRCMTVRLAWITAARPWTVAGQEPMELERLAARMLGRRWAQMSTAGEHIDELPVAALHVLRLRGKRMRYASEFFQPLFAGRAARRWVKRLAKLQERLGSLNDAAVAADLMTRLGPAGAGFAGGLVRGYVTAAATAARGRIGQGWRRLRRLDPFWK